MKSTSIFYTLVVISLMTSCLVPPPSTVNRVVVPPETLMKYRKFIPSNETIVRADYQKVYTELPDGHTRERTYYPEKYQCTHEKTYATAQASVLDGSYKEWWDDGAKKDEGQYKMGEKNGEWKTYSKGSGELTRVVNYTNGDKNGIEKNYDGAQLKSSYTYQQGSLEGDFMVYDSTGVLLNEGIYKADTIFQQSLEQDMESSTKTFKVVELMPMFPGCEEMETEKAKSCAQRKMLEFIYSNIKYPADAREYGIEGMSIIRFVVEKDGSITNIDATRGVSESIEAESIRVVKSMPSWNPGYQAGEPVKVQFNLPIRFKLQ